MTAPSAPASPGRVLAGLVRAGLVGASAACDGNVGLHEESRSNPVHLVVVSEIPKLAVKQPGPGPDAPALVEAEMATYRWLAAAPRIGSLAPSPTTVPDHEGWLVLEAPQGARTVHELWGTLGEDLAVVAAELGKTLASLHLAGAGAVRPAALPVARRPWVFDLPAGGSPDFAAAHEGPRRVVTELRERADLMALVEEAGNAWSARAPIHGDIKWDNVLARREPGGAWRLWLIDWELAGWGDPGWDVAGLAETIVTTQLLAGGASDAAARCTRNTQLLRLHCPRNNGYDGDDERHDRATRRHISGEGNRHFGWDDGRADQQALHNTRKNSRSNRERLASRRDHI